MLESSQYQTNDFPHRLRELRGADELEEFELSGAGASLFLNRLLPPGEADESKWKALTLAARDRAMVAIYQRYFGDEVSAQAQCPACGKQSGMQFALSEFVGSRLGHRAKDDPVGDWVLGAEGRARPPTIEDELLINEQVTAPEEQGEALIRLCVESADASEVDSLLEKVDELHPSISGELDVKCVHCEQEHTIDFSICEFVLIALVRERPIVLREVHCLARYYGWGLQEILALPRSQRRQLVELIVDESERVKGVA